MLPTNSFDTTLFFKFVAIFRTENFVYSSTVMFLLIVPPFTLCAATHNESSNLPGYHKVSLFQLASVTQKTAIKWRTKVFTAHEIQPDTSNLIPHQNTDTFSWRLSKIHQFYYFFLLNYLYLLFYFYMTQNRVLNYVMEEFREKVVYQVLTASLVSQDYLVATAVMDVTELKAKRDAWEALDSRGQLVHQVIKGIRENLVLRVHPAKEESEGREASLESQGRFSFPHAWIRTGKNVHGEQGTARTKVWSRWSITLILNSEVIGQIIMMKR